jgi:hypothetical protein
MVDAGRHIAAEAVPGRHIGGQAVLDRAPDFQFVALGLLRDDAEAAGVVLTVLDHAVVQLHEIDAA